MTTWMPIPTPPGHRDRPCPTCGGWGHRMHSGLVTTQTPARVSSGVPSPCPPVTD